MTRGRRFRFPWRSKAAIRIELDAEIAFHLDMRTAELVAAGVPEPEARHRAELEFGDMHATRKYCQAQDDAVERAAARGEGRDLGLDRVSDLA